MYKAVDFFCGIGGMTSGFRTAGINVLGGVDFDKECQLTYEQNNKGSKFLLADIKKLTFAELEQNIVISKNDDNLIFIGCSPCQYWSKIKTDKKKSQESRNLLSDFMKFVDFFNPGFIVIENVPGILTKADTPLTDFLKFLDKKKYKYDKAVVNAFQYGVPQTRKRFLLIASRVRSDIKIPRPNIRKIPTVRDFISTEKGFPILKAGITDSKNTLHTTAGLSQTNLLRLTKTPKNGGTRMAYVLDKKLAIPSQYKIKNAFGDTYGRMSWDKPAPTITTKFISISNGRFAHPEQDRGISLREGATLQTFSKNYKFLATGTGAIARHIGNAVPPLLSKAIAEAIMKS